MISFDRFTKRYDSITAVRELTFEVQPGEIVALLGPNGSGKTTTLKAAVGLLWPTSGFVRVAGVPAGRPEARRAIAFLPQKVSFPDALTGREVMTFYQRLRGTDPQRVDTALRFAALNGASERAVGNYSGGMMQRLGLAVAILPDTPITLLDEPTAALDPDGLCAFYGLVEERRRCGKTIVFSSHQLGDVEKLADRFGILVAGSLVAVMTRRELSDRLAERGVLRLRVDGQAPSLVGRVRTLAPQTTVSGDELIVPGPASIRPAVIDLVREAGVQIRGLTAEESSLESLYRELIRGGAA
jgi:Cu-processing system ATP-binding protein